MAGNIENYDIIHAKLENIRSLNYAINVDHLKTLVSLSSGAIAISITFLADSSEQFNGVNFLHASWFSFLLCISFCLARFSFIGHYIDKLGCAIHHYLSGNNDQGDDSEKDALKYSFVYVILSNFSLLYFFMGISFLFFFGFLNIR